LVAAQAQAALAEQHKQELVSYQIQAERMRELLAAKDVELGNFRSQTQQMAAQITMLQQEISSTRQQMQQQTVQLQNLEHALSRSRADHADAVVSHHAQARLSALHIASVQAELARSQHQEAQRAAEVSALTQQLAQLDQALHNLRRSASWRVTSPLRYFSAKLKRGPRGAAAAMVAAAPAGPAAGDLPHGFDSARYLQLNPDVEAAGADPVQHYLLYGRAEGRMFAPVDEEAQAEAPLSLDELPHDFDSSLYLQLNPDLLQIGVEPVQHYLRHGRLEGRPYLPIAAGPGRQHGVQQWSLHDLPHDFDSERYLRLNPDLDVPGVDPMEHYVLFGRQEGRAYLPCPVEHPPGAPSHLPADFDPEVYRKLNADLADRSIDVSAHYLHFGRNEGRPYAFPAIELSGEAGWRADRATAMVVSHEASRTGAPILSLNLVQALAKRYNVVAVLLGGGPLEQVFRQSGAIVVNLPQARQSAAVAAHLVEYLSKRYRFSFALVNSIVSRAMLAPLAEAFVPTISLVHEFASYTRPRDAVRNALLWSGEVVFSAKITMENAFAEYPDLGPRSAHILPQGRCVLPEGELSEAALLDEQVRLRRLMRPPQAQHAVVVLGAGFVQLRKGVELFIECAARVARAPGGQNCRFVWIGTGFNPDDDVAYSVYLADQVRRAGLQQQLVFIDETAAIETAYEEADMLLLSSRLDPLPNVAIDAMASRMPVLCFEQTTGIADFLIESGLRQHCVAKYLDSSELADKVLALANDPALRTEVAARCHQAAEAYFSMERYVNSLEQLAQGVASRSQQEYADTRTIIESGLFQAEFASGKHFSTETLEAQVRRYVRSWASGIDRRKPYPGFHPGIYLEQHGVATPGADPFADYIRAGQPQGPWNYRLVEAGLAASLGGPPPLRVALHLHVYYPDLLPEMLERLAYNRTQPDLFISICNEQVRPQVDEYLAAYAGRVAAIEVAPNRGRDIGPFLTAFGRRMINDYDVIGHLHTKKSADVKDASMGATWYRFLLENLLGSSAQAAMDDVMAALHADASLGMVFPLDPHVVGMGANQEFALELAGQLGLGPMPEHFLFPVGSMFWTRPAALAPILGLGLEWDDYPHEPLPYDGSMLHALERLFSLSLPLSGLTMAAMHTAGVTR
jgi:glycosyltransferase involved in cell wall biosynthesis